jgi:hypothetical protein
MEGTQQKRAEARLSQPVPLISPKQSPFLPYITEEGVIVKYMVL